MKFSRMKHRQVGLWGACLALLSTTAIADHFVPPTEKLAPFRRDRIPLHEDAIYSLSQNLTSAVRGAPYESPEHRRTAAKALALAYALNPKNENVTTQLSELSEGGKPNEIESERLDRAKNHILGHLKWLSSPEAGKDGNTLAALLGETMATMYPDDLQSGAYVGKSENSAWSGWVAETAAFNKPPEISKEELTQSEPEAEEKTEEKEIASREPVEKPKPSFKEGVILENARVKTVATVFDKSKLIWAPRVVSMEMSATKNPISPEGEKRWGFNLDLQANSDDYWQIQEDIAQPIKVLLEKEIGNMPERAGVQLRLDLGEGVSYSHRRNGAQTTAAGFVLAHAALSGNQPDGTFIGEISRDGKLGVPRFFWRSLIALTEESGGGTGGRLIVPAAAEPYFINMLALEKPELFFKYEILIASSPEEYITLSTRKVSSAHEETYAKFKIIREKLGTNAIGPYLNNRFVRERLQEIVNQAPYHLSAKILYLYGTPARPRYLTQEALAAEIWRKIDVVNDITKIEDFYAVTSSQIGKLNDHYERMRGDLDAIGRYADSRHSDLLRDAKELITALRSFGKAFEARGEMWEKSDKIDQARSEMREKNTALLKKLSAITGDPMPK